MKFLCSCLLFFAFLAVPIQARADLSYSEADKAVLAFFKVGNAVPDYDGWIKAMPEYYTAPKEDQERIYHEQDVRLKWAFADFDHTDNFLKITTAVFIRKIEKDNQFFLQFKFPEGGDLGAHIFPYPFRKEWVALSVEDLQNFESIPISENVAERIAPLFDSSDMIEGLLNLHVRPLGADYSASKLIDHMYFWLLRGDVAQFELRSQVEAHSYQSVITYTAPWYLNETESELLELMK